jgi:hypothetical protein
VQGRAHVELAKLASLAGDREALRVEVQRAVDLCERGNDPVCVNDAKRIR